MHTPDQANAAQAILDFWFDAHTQANWFAKDNAFDAAIRTQFFNTWQAAQQGECAHWRNTLHGRLAEIIVLDQFSRNLFRNQPAAFAQDGMALVLAQEAVQHSDYPKLSMHEKQFVIMPYMHSESALIHTHALALFEALDNPHALEFEQRHKAIIDTFGRYPHRNAALQRTSSPEETAFLQQAGSSF